MGFIDVEAADELVLDDPPIHLSVTDTSATPKVLRRFPWGWYFDRSNGWLPAVSRGIARFISRLVERRAAFVRNMDPRHADELLDEYESMVGTQPAADQTEQDRRDAVLTQMRARGGVNASYYEQVAIDFGYIVISVTDAADPFTTESLCDDFLQDAEWKLAFKMTVETQGAVRDQLLEDLINGQLLEGWYALFEFV